jgi:hypothetical protein
MNKQILNTNIICEIKQNIFELNENIFNLKNNDVDDDLIIELILLNCFLKNYICVEIENIIKNNTN